MHGRCRGRGHRRGLLLASLFGALLLVAGGLVIVDSMRHPAGRTAGPDAVAVTASSAGHRPGGTATPAGGDAVAAGSAGASVTATPLPAGGPTASPKTAARAGTGSFGYSGQSGAVLGTGGGLRRFQVAVETGVNVPVDEFAGGVEVALGDARSWIASGALRLQRVPGGATHEFTVYLVTPATAYRMCLAGGTNIRVGGVPYTSCRAGSKVIINLSRWQGAVPGYGASLGVYRKYVINHEVGHYLGHHHEACPGAGRPAPVMQQQTLFLSGCLANPWPYLDGRAYSGPPAARR